MTYDDLVEKVRLTPAQKRALLWFRDNEPVSAFPRDGIAPSLKFVRRLEALGFVERVGREAGMWGFTTFAMSEAGRAALSPVDREGE